MNKTPHDGSSPLEALHAPWDKNANAIWLASTVKTFRNIEKFKFSHKLEPDQKTHLLQLASKAALQSPEFLNPVLLKAEEMTPSEKEFLIEHFLLFEGFQEAHQGSGFILDESGETIVLFNIKEHLQIQVTDSSLDMQKCWMKACARCYQRI